MGAFVRSDSAGARNGKVGNRREKRIRETAGFRDAVSSRSGNAGSHGAGDDGRGSATPGSHGFRALELAKDEVRELRFFSSIEQIGRDLHYRCAPIPPGASVHGYRSFDISGGDCGQHRHILCGARCSASAVALQRSRSTGLHLAR